jgi:hypothetical protein
MSYRITDRRGHTVGYAHHQGAELLGALLVGAGMIGLAVVLAPILAVLYGIGWVLPWYLVFWTWATELPLTRFPNLNGVLVLAALGLTGAVLVRVVRFHIMLLHALGHVVSMLLAALMAAIWLGLVYLGVGAPLALFALAGAWLFSSPNVLYITLGVLLMPAVVFQTDYWTWLLPLVLPIGWGCGHLVRLVTRSDFLVTASNLTAGAGATFLLMAGLVWLGMVGLQWVTGLDNWGLMALGAVAGPGIYGLLKGAYRVLTQGVRTVEDMKTG